MLNVSSRRRTTIEGFDVCRDKYAETQLKHKAEAVCSDGRNARGRAWSATPATYVGIAGATLWFLGSTMAFAQEFKAGPVNFSVHGGATIGTVIRADNPDPQLVAIPNANVLNIPSNGSGRNGDDGNLNFKKGQAVSTVLKGWLSVDAKYNDFGVFVRGKGWTDYTLENSPVPWGNYPNGLTPNIPLSDKGFENRAKFTSFALQQAYLYGKLAPNLEFRVGNQNIPWGIPFAIAGGISALNPFDFPAARRAGAVGEELAIPVPAAFVKFAATPKLTLEGFWQFGAARNAYDGCGTLFAIADFFPTGCNFGLASGPFTNTDRQYLALGGTISKVDSPDNNELRQGGIGARYTIDAINTEVGAYYAHYHARYAAIDISRTFRVSPTVPFIAGNPDGGNPIYRISYAPDIDMFAVNFQTKFATKTTLSAEYVYRPNQSVGLPGGEVLAAAVTAVAPSLFRAPLYAQAPGSFYPGYDRLQTGALNVGVTQNLEGFAGAKSVVLSGEIAVRQIYGLPDPTVRRYLRSDTFGNGPVNGICPVPNPGVNYIGCTYDGYASSNAWGFRLASTFNYEVSQVPGLNLAISGSYGKDVSGWSADGNISEGRNVGSVRLRAEYKKAYFAELAYLPIWGGDFFTQRDRSVYTAAMGVRF